DREHALSLEPRRYGPESAPRAGRDENFFIAHRVKRHAGGHHQKGKRRKEGEQMKRAIVLALVLLAAVAAPLSGVAYAGTNAAAGLDPRVALLWKQQMEGQPVIRVAAGPQPSSVSLSDGTADRQPHPQAIALGREEGIEELLEVMRRSSDTRVLHADEDAGAI